MVRLYLFIDEDIWQKHSKICLAKVRSPESVAVMIPLKDTIPHKNSPYITWLLILGNLVSLLYQSMLSPGALNRFIMAYGFIPGDLTLVLEQKLQLESLFYLQPLLTSLFLHGSWIHLIGNMWMLWLFGDNVEDYAGHFPFLLFYLVSGLAASMAHFAFNMSSQIPTIGASGAVAGVMGAYFVLFPRARIITLVPIFWIPFFLKIPAVLFIGFWFASQFLLGVSDLLGPADQGGVAWWAHIGGFIFGFLAIRLCRSKRSPQRPVYDSDPVRYRYR